ncbi:MAG: sulfite exporter TauE/SafE family protein [Actinomycetota bacterium]
MKELAFVLAGVAAGVFSGALGVGGALLATPLIRFLGVAPYLAIGTTVPVMLPTTVTGAIIYRRAGLLDLRSAAWTAGAAAPATAAGAFTTRHVNGHALMLMTAAILVVLALRAFASRSGEEGQTEIRRSAASLVAVGVAAGFFSGLLGVGGGFILVPVFVRALRFPVKVALGTSLAVIALATVPNIAAQSLVGNIDWKVALLLALGVVPGARAGSLLAIRASERRLRIAIVVCVLVVGLAYAGVEAAALIGS